MIRRKLTGLVNTSLIINLNQDLNAKKKHVMKTVMSATINMMNIKYAKEN